ncbi:circularly permuted type 2 ATP-grasp protein [Hoeflea sp. WL0058]|uniref:Circularly permuted type 2 ATP-grasp protein n=1 Tax=Flavimaribacter sediminis TaxID=2865987 RepID=A0AAE2ZQU4_9HYPH|nr:circularly permuted type 2 ATP-grasp protein [Flavimaribacter sediminis]MBW8639265.1 circularly permuted type 2 ATP-grasp protein [Flavimaribacter sediminis]
MPVQGAAPTPDAIARLLSGYRTMPGVPDELMSEAGAVRPVWLNLLETLSTMTTDELSARMARGDQYLRDAGVFYRQYDADKVSERDWPLSHMPVLIDEDEWTKISAGLVQRADLLEKVIADIYGENRLVADGHIPADLVANNPEWLRPLVGVEPRSGHFLHFLAFDIGRGPQGQWWVIGDRTQAPSGAGFALENRIATTRVFAETYASSHIHRVAGFFRTFRDSMLALRGGDEGRVGILTPGLMNDTYFEHAYIARYLGFMLLEGEDLTVTNGELMVRTVAGLRPVSVLWRRLDAVWADPLELDENSRIGTPGLLGAIRAGNVTMVNALGSGILETRAFLAFLPRISEAINGEALSMPNIATWWCGQQAERDYVKANASAMTIGNAYATRLLSDFDDVSAIGGAFNREIGQSLEDWIDQGAGELVGQEAVMLSTTPAFQDGNLTPRPMSLRVFLMRTADGWQVMPGGFARIGKSDRSAALAMQQGGSAADVWIVSKNPVPNDTMLSPAAASFMRKQTSALPSRSADNLFWMGRYVERAENMIRLFRAYHVRLSEAEGAGTPLLQSLHDYLKGMGSDPDAAFPEGIVATLQSASHAAGNVRDRFSVDGWTALDDLTRAVEDMQRHALPGADMAGSMSVLLRKLSGFSGLVHENMYRFTGWRFLSIGRSLERAGALLGALAWFADEAAPDGGFDLVIEIADSSMTHRRRYAVATNRSTVVDLLALDPLNPRSVIYQLNDINTHIGFLPGVDPHQRLTPLQRAVLEAQTSLSLKTTDTVGTDELLELGQKVTAISERLAAAYLR